MNWHSLTVGIEHLFTGICFHPHETENPPFPGGFQFEKESASIFRVYSPVPFYAVWNQRITAESQPCAAPPERSYGSVEGPAQYYAQVVGPAMVDLDNKLRIDSQTYSRKAEWAIKDGPNKLSRFAPNEPTPFPQAVVDAIMRKHGAKSFEVLASLRWAGDHWYYTSGNMYVGVEPDGYIHT